MINEEDQYMLLTIARHAIENGLKSPGNFYTPDESVLSDQLKEHGAAFVTLELDNRLRGCIGSLEAYRPLAQDVAANAYAAAFSDPRFAPLAVSEFNRLHISISVLTEPEPMQFESEQDLLNQLNPGEDGLILESGYHRGTFLPSVWESLSTPELFLQQLKSKAGLAENYWSDDIKISRYHTESFACNIEEIAHPA